MSKALQLPSNLAIQNVSLSRTAAESPYYAGNAIGGVSTLEEAWPH